MSLVLHYKFNDPATFTTDSSGNSNTLVNIDGVDSADDATYGTVASFSNNPTNYFSLASAPTSITGSSSRTYSYWVKQVGNETYRIMFGQAWSPEYRIQFSGSFMEIVGGSGQSGNPSSIGQWVHISITYDGSTERVYFDGTLTNSANISLNTSTGSLFIGSAPRYPTGFSMSGYMVDFRIYDDALSDTDVSALYTDGPNPTTGIVQDGALGYFDANNTDSYTSGSETMYDLLGSDLTMVTVPGLVPPLNDGGLDFSTQTNYMQTSNKIVIRTISLWYKKTDSVLSNPVFLDQGEVGNFIQNTFGGTGSKHGPFFESCTVYVDGVETNLSDWNNLAHGELHNVVFMGSKDSVESILTIFANPAPAYTFRAILYSILLYGRELTDEELIQNYEAGPGSDVQIVDTAEEEEEEEEVTSVDWVQDSNSRYEVRSKAHLLQIMQNGSYLDNTGSTPANYRSVSFVQTADIDLESDITNIVPISTFTGTYDGQNFAISNWSCTPVNGKGTAMFGYTNGATIQNVHLNGVWSTLNTNDGSLFAAHNSNSTFTNISTYFSSGTEITAVANSLGGLFSYTGNCTIQNVTLGGTIDTFQGTAYTGGIVGYSSGSTYSHVRNIATFVTPLIGHVTGGIAGYYGGTSGYILNAMRGDIQGGNRTGGVYGISSGGLNYVCNSMIGNISGTSAAGVVSSISSGGTCSFIVNYMTGDVAHGLMGSASSTTLVNSIVAMTGVTGSAAFGSGHGSSQVLLDESYGITYTSNSGTVSTMDTSAFETSFGLTSQPYWEFTNSPQWPFVFGNVGINTSFDWILASGASETLGVNDLGILVDTGGTLENIPVTATPSVFFLDLKWEAIESSLSYKVEYTSEDSSETVSIVTSTTNLRISNLEANSAYTISLFSSSGDPTTYEQVGDSGSFSTLENVVANIDVETLKNSEGVFDISDFETDDLDQHMNALFDTGDQVIRSVNNEPVTTTFVKDGESYPLEAGVFSFAFSPSIGAGQTASLGDANISFDEVNNVIVVDGVSYADGESFSINGKIITVYNI